MTRTFETHPLPETLRDLLFDQASGVLSVQGAGFRADVMLDRGSVIYCRSDAPAQKLENLLVKWGFATAEQVPHLVRSAGANVKAGLVQQGIFPTEAAFDDFMGQILRERVLELFAQPQAAFDFVVKDVSSLKQVAFPSSTPDVILEGCRRLANAATFLEPLKDDDVALQLNDRPAVTLESLHMAPAEGYVLSLVTGASVPAEIVRVSPLGAEETLRLLYALLVLDLVRHPAFTGQRFSILELRRKQAADQKRDAAEREIIDAEYRRVRALDLFHVVPNASTLDPDALRQAVKAYQENWKTDRFSSRIARDLREQLTLIQGRAGELLLAAMDAGRKQKAEADFQPAAADPADDGSKFKRLEFMKSDAQAQLDADHKMAQAYFARACEAYRGKDYHSTIQFVREAIRHHETAEYQALLGDALAMNPHWGKRAEEAYMRAMQLDQYDPRLPMALGRIYARAGLKQRAREQFDKALGIQPDLEDAKQAIRELGK